PRHAADPRPKGHRAPPPLPQDMVDGLPVSPRALQDNDGAAWLVAPGPQGQALVRRGTKVTPCGMDRAILTHPASTRRQLRRRASKPTTHGVHEVHDVALLEG